MKIEIDRLEILFSQILRKLRELGIDHVDVKYDFYWLISSADWAKFDKSPKEPVIGSLADDWNSLVKVSRDEHPMMFVDFDRVSSILRAISEELNSEEDDSPITD